MTRLTDERIAEIKAREQSATKGPWANISDWPQVWSESPEIYGQIVALCGIEKMTRKNKCGDDQPPDSEFIAHSRTDVPDLLAEVEALRRENARLRAALEPFASLVSNFETLPDSAPLKVVRYGGAGMSDFNVTHLHAAKAALDGGKMTPCTKETLAEIVARIGGIRKGAHIGTNDECNILEAVALWQGREKTDDPELLNIPDVYPLNNAPWSNDAIRTEQMLRLAPLFEAWPKWDSTRRSEYTTRLAFLTIKHALPEVSQIVELPKETRAHIKPQTLIDAYTALSSSHSAKECASAASGFPQESHNAYEYAYQAARYAVQAAYAAGKSFAAYAGADAADKILTKFIDQWVAALEAEK